MREPEPQDQPYSSAWVEVLETVEDYRYEHFCKVIRSRLRFRLTNLAMSAPVTRLDFARGNAVGILLYDRRQDHVLLVRQFRFPVYASLSRDQRQGAGARQAWLLEIVAGIAEAGQTLTETAQREVSEESGFQLEGGLLSFGEFYPSPGGSSERISLFLAAVDPTQRTGQGGGLADEGEDTELVAIPRSAALEMVERGDILDGKTIIALLRLERHLSGPPLQSASQAKSP